MYKFLREIKLDSLYLFIPMKIYFKIFSANDEKKGWVNANGVPVLQVDWQKPLTRETQSTSFSLQCMLLYF